MSPSKLFLSTGRLSRHFPPTRMSPARKKSTFYGYDKLAISLMLNEVAWGWSWFGCCIWQALFSANQWLASRGVNEFSSPHLAAARHCCVKLSVIQTLCLTGSHEAPWCLGASHDSDIVFDRLPWSTVMPRCKSRMTGLLWRKWTFLASPSSTCRTSKRQKTCELVVWRQESL